MVYGAMPNDGIAVPVEKAVVGVACVGIMVLGLGCPGLSGFLLFPALKFVGRISCSYYLVHLPVSKLVPYLLHDQISVITPVVVIAGSRLVAWIAYRWIEIPSIRLGHRIYEQIRSRMAAPIAVVLAEA